MRDGGYTLQQHVLPTLTDTQRSSTRATLPSTSGAHASLSFDKKVARWSVLWDTDARDPTVRDDS
jgi:hypothetical protein